MGTRADFYVGRGENAEWLGSIAWDGYPEGIDTPALVEATDVDSYRGAVAGFLARREDATLPEMGWPWPWEDSCTTDYAYAFDGGQVWASCFGHDWFLASAGEPEENEDDDESSRGKTAVFPNMKTQSAAPAGSKRSGIMVFTVPR